MLDDKGSWRLGSRAATMGLLLAAVSGTALAQSPAWHLAPLTKLRLSVVQFMPASGDYRRWDALNSDLEVSADGTVLVPTLGPMPVGTMTPDELAATISERLQAKLGLVDRPDATLQVVEYPPIYLVGSVTTPGQYPFRPGMTVLQAVAVGGGDYRGNSQNSMSDTIKLQGDLETMANDTVRTTARIARLEAELAGAAEIDFPPALNASDPTVAEVMRQERVIFAARRNEIGRQTSALDDLTALFNAELDALQQKAASIDDQIKQAQLQLDNVKDLVSKGVATVSRQSDLERAVAGLRSDRLDNIIATMNARQGLNQALRDRAKLEDDHRSEVSVALQTEQANLERLRFSQATTTRLLRQASDFDSEARKGQASQSYAYTIIRPGDAGAPTELAASESTPLMPGDLLKVALVVGPSAVSGTAAADAGSPASSASLR